MHRASRFAIDPHWIDLSRIVFWLGVASALVLVALAIVPLEAIERGPAVCPFKRFLGIECYGCGMTRALSAFLHGNVRGALAYNRGVLLTLPGLATLALLPVGAIRRHDRESKDA